MLIYGLIFCITVVYEYYEIHGDRGDTAFMSVVCCKRAEIRDKKSFKK